MQPGTLDLGTSGTPPDETISDLYARHALGLIRLALIMVGDRESAEDVVQDAFLGLHRRFGRLRDPDKALVYLRSSVLNNARTLLRRRRLPSWFAGAYEPPVWSAESAALLGAERRAVLEALHRLPHRQREALVLRYYADLSEEETAQVMGVSRGTVKSTTHRAPQALGRLLGRDERSPHRTAPRRHRSRRRDRPGRTAAGAPPDPPVVAGPRRGRADRGGGRRRGRSRRPARRRGHVHRPRRPGLLHPDPGPAHLGAAGLRRPGGGRDRRTGRR